MTDLNYMTTKTAATTWNISQRRVLALCADDRIDGLARVENIWLIPKNAKKPKDARTIRYSKEIASADIRPFLKWAGGKGQLLDCIRAKYPAELGESIQKYAEPFVGGGAVLFDVLSRYHLSEVYISDTNAELINTYQLIKDDVNDLIAMLADMQETYLPESDEYRRQYYNEQRARYNEIKGKSGQQLDRAALFIFLNRTCFNGLYRVNRHGMFNVPIGAYKRPLICDAENLQNVSKVMQKVEIICGDYRKSSDFIDKDTFVYFDPPYRPLTKTAEFTAYTENGFDDIEQESLAKYAIELWQRGTRVVLSNSDPKNVNKKDNFFDDLYAQFIIQRVDATRAINSDKEKRGKIKELLIANF